ncbi:MAG: hypothetical protein KDI72_05940 [Xanthomonadales bacterium]|jgi:hypothetical protein|nr:hypothetical protein [Xanthomonadales bacterium]
MNSASHETPTMAWYRVPEVWLMLVLLGAMVIGSFALLSSAIRTPDTHIVVPNDVPRPSRIPPIQRAPTSEAAKPTEHRQAS